MCFYDNLFSYNNLCPCIYSHQLLPLLETLPCWLSYTAAVLAAKSESKITLTQIYSFALFFSS